jgi:hypothetical protein
MAEDTNFKTGDSLWALTRKILSRLNQGIATTGGGGGGGGGGQITILDGSGTGDVAVVNTNAASPGTPSLAVTVQQPATVQQPTASLLNATVVGNVGGKTFVLKVNPTISTAAYVAGYTVGAIQTLTNAVTISSGTGILESLILLDKSNQKAAMDIFIFESNPAAATTTDHAAFVFSTDNLKVIARVSLMATDYATVNGQGIAVKSGLGIAVKANGSANLYAVAVTSGTPTYTGANDLQWVWGILQD